MTVVRSCGVVLRGLPIDAVVERALAAHRAATDDERFDAEEVGRYFDYVEERIGELSASEEASGDRPADSIAAS